MNVTVQLIKWWWLISAPAQLPFPSGFWHDRCVGTYHSRLIRLTSILGWRTETKVVGIHPVVKIIRTDQIYEFWGTANSTTVNAAKLTHINLNTPSGLCIIHMPEILRKVLYSCYSAFSALLDLQIRVEITPSSSPKKSRYLRTTSRACFIRENRLACWSSWISIYIGNMKAWKRWEYAKGFFITGEGEVVDLMPSYWRGFADVKWASLSWSLRTVFFKCEQMQRRSNPSQILNERSGIRNVTVLRQMWSINYPFRHPLAKINPRLKRQSGTHNVVHCIARPDAVLNIKMWEGWITRQKWRKLRL